MRDLESVFQKVDLLATPTAAMPAPKLDAGPGEIGAPTGALRSALRRLTQPFNITGGPAITVPCGFSRNGLPIGLQLVGRPFGGMRAIMASSNVVGGRPRLGSSRPGAWGRRGTGARAMTGGVSGTAGVIQPGIRLRLTDVSVVESMPASTRS